jgi:hypothetical protein
MLRPGCLALPDVRRRPWIAERSRQDGYHQASDCVIIQRQYTGVQEAAP